MFRPDAPGTFPVIINMGIYQKDKLWVPPHDLEEGPNPYMNWETVNPEWWCRAATSACASTCAARASRRASHRLFGAGGDRLLRRHRMDRPQPWCSGNVGIIGISFIARTQWRVANLQPPSLKAIMPWEGAADQYRDLLYHGGIFALASSATGSPAHGAPSARPRRRAQPRRVPEQPAVDDDAQRPRLRRFKSQRRAGTASRCRSTASATGAASRCICAATPRASCAPHRSTRSCASTPARTSTRSTARRAGRTSCAGSTTG